MRKDSNRQVNTCPSCKTKFEGKFCPNDGEKAFHESDYTIRKFLEQTVDVFTHFDGKFVRSALYIFTKPGFLTEQNMHGIRVKYAKPMQIFLLANILFFFITHWVGVTDYTPNIGDERYGGISSYYIFRWLAPLDQWVISHIEGLKLMKTDLFGISADEFRQRFWLNSYIYSKSFIVLIIPFSSFAIYMLYKKRFKYFSNALVFTAHFLSFQLVVFSILSIFRYRFGFSLFKPLLYIYDLERIQTFTYFVFGSSFEFSQMLYWMPYLFLAFRRVFPQEHPFLALLKAYLTSRILYFVAFVLYKKLLIVLTLLLMH